MRPTSVAYRTVVNDLRRRGVEANEAFGGVASPPVHMQKTEGFGRAPPEAR